MSALKACPTFRCIWNILAALGVLLIAIGTPRPLVAQTAELLPVESQFLAPLMKELNQFTPPKENPELGRRPVVSYEIVSRTQSGRLSEIVAESKYGFVGYKLQISPSVADQPLLYAKELVVLSELMGKRSSRSQPLFSQPSPMEQMLGQLTQETTLDAFEAAETLANIQAGSQTSKYRWGVLELAWMKTRTLSTSVFSLMSQWTGESPSVLSQKLDQRLSSEIEKMTQETQPELKARADKEFSKNSKVVDAKSPDLKELEEQKLKLNDLIVRNDRAGVRRMIEAYLPWEIMEPVESRIWKNWLEAIEFPDPSKKVVAFRGVDYSTDSVQSLRTAEGQNLGFMSTLLTKNQGNYTRRLRSLRTKRLDVGDQMGDRWKIPRSVLVSEQMRAHAIDPIGSPFLSFTLDPMVAKDFIGDVRYDKNGQAKPGGGLLAVSMDSRRLFPNLRNGVLMEVEYLAPLVVFPDEILESREIESSSRTERVQAMNELLDSIRKKHGNVFQQSPMKDFQTRSQFMKSGKSFVNHFFEETSGRSCRHVWN